MQVTLETIENTTYASITVRGVESTVCLEAGWGFYTCTTSRKSSQTVTSYSLTLAEMRKKSKAFAALADVVEGELVA